MNSKNIFFITTAALILLADFFGSVYFILKKTPQEFIYQLLSISGKQAELQNTLSLNKEESIIIKQSDFNLNKISAGQNVAVNCNYENTTSKPKDVLTELYLINQNRIYDLVNSEKSHFYLSSGDDILQLGEGQIIFNLTVPENIIRGNYKFLINIYDPVEKKLISACQTSQFNVENNKQIVYLYLQTEDPVNRIKLLRQAQEKFYLKVISPVKIDNFKPRISLYDPLKKSQPIFTKEFDSISLNKNSPLNLEYNLDGFTKEGIFYIGLDLTEEPSESVSALLPVSGIYIGIIPEILTATMKAVDDSNLQLNIAYLRDSDVFPQGTYLSATACSSTECFFENVIMNKPLKDIMIKKVNKAQTVYKINVQIRTTGLLGYITKYSKLER